MPPSVIMPDDPDKTPTDPLGWALASGAILTLLLDKLVSEKVLSAGEVRDILTHASNGLVGFYHSPGGTEAGRVITYLLRRFPESRA